MHHTRHKLYLLLPVFLFLGTLIAWYTNIKGFIVFYNYEQTIFKFVDCTITNPFLTPCFWGAVAFFVLFIWSIRLLFVVDVVEQKKQLRVLLPILAGCVLFGWSNVVIEAYQFFSHEPGAIIGCGGKPLLNPFTSSCFFGSLLFTLSFVVVLVVHRENNRREEIK